MNKNTWLTLWMIPAALSSLRGAGYADTFYVATDGSAAQDGSYAKPWPSVEHALAQTGGGHTIVLKSGEYHGPITVPAKAAGTEKSPTVIKAEKKWQT